MLPVHPPYSVIRARYAAYLLLERGLADNTRMAYQADIDRLQVWLADIGLDYHEVQIEHLERFVAHWLIEQSYLDADLGLFSLTCRANLFILTFSTDAWKAKEGKTIL